MLEMRDADDIHSRRYASEKKWQGPKSTGFSQKYLAVRYLLNENYLFSS